jgi:hypothetical protein
MLRKFTGVEKTEVLSPDQHKAVEVQLHAMGKTSAANLTEDERNSLNIPVDTQNQTQ